MIGSENPAVPDTDGSDVRGFHNYAPWLNVICGLLVFTLRYLSPRGTFSVHWNLFLTGIVIMFAALATTISHGNTTTNYWPAIDVFAGVWLLISTHLIPSTPTVTLAQDGLGFAIIAIAILSLLGEMRSRRNVAEERSEPSG